MENIPTYSDYINNFKYSNEFLEIYDKIIKKINSELKMGNEHFLITFLDDLPDDFYKINEYLNQKLNQKGWFVNVENTDDLQVELKKYKH